jgi:error-prone DNA polymerase
VAARAQAPFTSTEDLSLRAQLDVKDLNALAAADALQSCRATGASRCGTPPPATARPRCCAARRSTRPRWQLPPAPEGEEILFDYAAMGLTLRRHPLALLRERLARWGYLNAQAAAALPHGRRPPPAAS